MRLLNTPVIYPSYSYIVRSYVLLILSILFPDGGKSLLEDGGVVMQGRSFVAQLLQPLPRCLVVLEREPELLVALDEGLYMRRVLRSISTDKSNAATRHSCERFIRQLLRTQCFSQYLLEFV